MGKIWNFLIGRSTKELNSENSLVNFPNKEKGGKYGRLWGIYTYFTPLIYMNYFLIRSFFLIVISNMNDLNGWIRNMSLFTNY